MPTNVKAQRMTSTISDDGTEWTLCIEAKKPEFDAIPLKACITFSVDDPTADNVDAIAAAEDWTFV